MPELCVVHLARHVNGWEPFERFMRSYELHPAGVDHDLVIALKGFPGPDIPPEYPERVAPHGGTVLPLEDTGFDIGSYWAAAEALSCTSFCFLNSFSVILDDGWLAKLARHHGPSVGVVGASGSWQSHLSGSSVALRGGLLLPPWRIASDPFPARRLGARDRGWLVRDFLKRWAELPPFPNPHIRTNAFLIRRDLMLDIEVPELLVKMDALRFESGRRSFTRQILSRRLQILVVGRDGVAYPPDEWPESHTFRVGDQANLIVADNRTDEWLTAPSPLKEDEAASAWGRNGHRPMRIRRPPGLSSSRPR
ncbi:MAG: hypothetical protein JWM17_100 [Actinobacteria bacterium]|nr:hypothetical protein [Actinomycetota bacterium]